MIRGLALAFSLVVVLGACSSTKTVHLTAGVSQYDVNAARLCEAFKVYVDDAKANKTSVDDSTALDNADKAVKAGHPAATSKWAPLTGNVDSFLFDAGRNDAADIPAIGLKIGQQCSTIPVLAQKAGDYS